MMNQSLVASLRADVAALAISEGRMVGSEGHEQARNFLCKRMSDLGLECYNGATDYVHPYRSGQQQFFNLVGVVSGADRQARPVLLGAHYDSFIDAPCADDNAAAVAIILAVAERLLHVPPARDVLVALFDAEEQPYFLSQAMGSVRFVLDQMDARGVGLALIQDLTGHDVSLPVPVLGDTTLPKIKDLVFVTGAESHPMLAGMVQAALAKSDLPLVATLDEHMGDMSDHFAFRTMNLPYLFFSCGRWEHYHQRSDTPEKLNYQKMARIVDLLTGVTLVCAQGDLPKVTSEADTAPFEIEMLERAFGALLPTLLRSVGVQKLQNRADLDTLVTSLTRLGL